MSGSKRWSVLMFFGLVTPIFVLLGRVEVGASTACELARQSETKGDLEEAAFQYQQCVKWNTFITNKSDWALDQLNRISVTAEGQGELDLALLAARYSRGSVLATNHIWRLTDTENSTINQRVAELTARLQHRSGSTTVRGRSLSQLEADHRALLERRNGPSPVDGTIVFLFFVGWVSSCAWAIWRGLSPEGTVNKGPMFRAICVMIVLFGLFCLALSTANA